VCARVTGSQSFAEELSGVFAVLQPKIRYGKGFFFLAQEIQIRMNDTPQPTFTFKCSLK